MLLFSSRSRIRKTLFSKLFLLKGANVNKKTAVSGANAYSYKPPEGKNSFSTVIVACYTKHVKVTV